MPVKITYSEDQTTEQVTEPITIESTAVEVVGDVAETVDTYGAMSEQLSVLEGQVKALKAEMLPHEGILREAADEFSADEDVTLKGGIFRVDLKKRGVKVTHIDKGGLLKQLGSQTWFDITVPSTADLRKYLTPPQLAKLLKEERTGNRSIKAKKL